jgi:hypothetical protein
MSQGGRRGHHGFRDVPGGELQAARARSDRLQRRVDANGGVSAGEALAELQTMLEELRVTEEELRVQNDQLTGLYAIDADRDRWQDPFEPPGRLAADRSAAPQKRPPGGPGGRRAGARPRRRGHRAALGAPSGDRALGAELMLASRQRDRPSLPAG